MTTVTERRIVREISQEEEEGGGRGGGAGEEDEEEERVVRREDIDPSNGMGSDYWKNVFNLTDDDARVRIDNISERVADDRDTRQTLYPTKVATD